MARSFRKWARLVEAVLAGALLVGACAPTAEQVVAPATSGAAPESASPAPSPSPRPSAAPTRTPYPTLAPTPAPVIPTDAQLAAACRGKPVPGAAPFSGDVHPLVVVEKDYDGHWSIDPVNDLVSDYAVNAAWREGSWDGAVQLVLCVDAEWPGVRLGSCGWYERKDDKKVGEIVRYQRRDTVRVVVAATGKVLQSKHFLGAAPAKCGTAISLPPFIGPPPWPLSGEPVAPETVDRYAVTVSTQSTVVPAPAPTPKATPRPITAGYCPSPAKQYSKSGTARSFLYGQYPPEWTALLTLKLTVCVSNGRIAWATTAVSQRRASGVTGGPWAGPFFMKETSTVREVMLTATYLYKGLRSEPGVIIRFSVSAGFYDVTLSNQVFY